MKIAEIIINVAARAVNQSYTYAVPSELDFLAPGWRVIVPFGSREMEGFIISVKEGSDDGLKQIKSALDDTCWFDPLMIKLAEWLSDYYLCTLAEALRLFIPGKQGVKTEQYYHLAESDWQQVIQRETDCQLLSFIEQKQPVRLSALTKQFGPDVIRNLRSLAGQGLISAASQATAREQTRYCQEYQLNTAAVADLGSEYSRRPAQRHLIELLAERDSIAKEELKQLGISADTVKKLVNTGVITCHLITQRSDSYADRPRAASSVKELNQEQAACLAKIGDAVTAERYQSFLLHGITGSGKTEIYLEAAAKVRAQGRQAIILVPEIALTGQIVARFKARFAQDVVVFHSKLSLQERYDAWRRLKEGSAGIAIGARSAVFAPTNKLGLVVVDEEHEFTYKQEESPRYHARDVAVKRAELCSAVVILGSATPSIESYQNAVSGCYSLLELTERADAASLPSVEVVDMREELALGRRSVISERLASLLQETVQRGEQAIVLLNRRGHSTFLLCRECGFVLRCRHCAVSLVYHANDRNLRCHYCRQPEPVPDICPVCQSRYIRYFGAGTQKAEEELNRLLPGVRLLRMDQDTTGARFAADNMLAAFQAGKYDILLGTQMVAKGHDIANVTAVGILAADTTLNLPDFRAAEKTFALITQAAGRAGRGKKAGTVVVQTYNPEHYAVQFGAAQDYRQFFNAEAGFRQSLMYPPFTHLIRCTVASEDEANARRIAESLAVTLRNGAGGTEILGPFPSAIAKVKDVYRMNLLIKSPQPAAIKQLLSKLPLAAKREVTIDVDPYNML